ncbi:gluconate 2-dehydrogenase subunit 3 family protein [Phenylobacterium sp.]|uniref:gluconate 2-dehydrogenase subunit 3 family protein n=1 Tax=Phenylobacterium sp. TaxID=1871053 RepID=UPI00301E2F04
MQSRRDALLTFAAAWGVLSLPAGAAAQPAVAVGANLGWTPSGVTLSQAQVLDALAELIAPATDTPGAREAGVPAYVDRTIAGYCTAAEAGEFRGVLDALDADARARHGKGFATLSIADQAAIAATYDRGQKFSPFGRLKEVVLVGYFSSEPGATVAVRYDPIPGDYKGCIPLSEVGRAWAL